MLSAQIPVNTDILQGVSVRDVRLRPTETSISIDMEDPERDLPRSKTAVDVTVLRGMEVRIRVPQSVLDMTFKAAARELEAKPIVEEHRFKVDLHDVNFEILPNGVAISGGVSLHVQGTLTQVMGADPHLTLQVRFPLAPFWIEKGRAHFHVSKPTIELPATYNPIFREAFSWLKSTAHLEERIQTGTQEALSRFNGEQLVAIAREMSEDDAALRRVTQFIDPASASGRLAPSSDGSTELVVFLAPTKKGKRTVVAVGILGTLLVIGIVVAVSIAVTRAA